MSQLSVFLLGVCTGMYLAQTYDIPNLKNIVEKGIKISKDWEK